VKTKSLVLLVVVVGTALGVVAAGAGASRPTGFFYVTADLTLRPGVSRSSHPSIRPPGLYGAFDGTYTVRSNRLSYGLEFKGLSGSAFRVVVRSRATGARYAVLCGPCNVRPRTQRGNEGLPVSVLAGTVTLNPDVGYLMEGNRTFVEVDTTAYPAGEIGGQIFGFRPPVTRSTPRCC
jgi:hypothetical protein